MSIKILVIRFSSFGDVVLTTALFPSLKANWPEGTVSVLTKQVYAPIYEGNKSIDRIIAFSPESESYADLVKKIRAEKYDLIIDLHGNIRSYFIRLFAGPPLAIVVRKAGWARRKLVLFKQTSKELQKSVRDRILDVLNRLDIPIVNHETQLFTSHVDETFEKYDIPQGQMLIGIAPGAKHKTKRWPLERFAESANRLGAFPHTTVLLLGDQSDRSVGDQITSKLVVNYRNLIGETSMAELKNVVSKLSFLLTNDSGLLHMGEAFKIPLVALFGPTVRGFGFAPYRATSRVVEAINLKCRPCTLHGDEACPLKHHRCMNDLDVSAVMFASSDILGSK